LNSKSSEDDGAEKRKGRHHCEYIEFQRQTHGKTSEYPTKMEVNGNFRTLQKENAAAPRQFGKRLK